MPEQEPSQVITVEGVSKVYRVYGSPVDRLRRALGLGGHFIDFSALEAVSLTVDAGEAVGIIGENGAGKSTLLKIISGTTAATTGQVQVQGRLTSILELGAGFHHEFSGRENALLYGAIMGLDQEQMTNRLGDIINFAELGPFLEYPVKVYSTGMVMRLAFAVATHVDADVLVVDEALAVGDGYFQKKCVDRILEIKQAGATVLFCSHATYQISTFCDRVVWLRQGRIEQQGPTTPVVSAYEAYLLHRGKGKAGAHGIAATAETAAQETPTVGLRVGRITAVQVSGEVEVEVEEDELLLRPNDGMTVAVTAASTRREERYHLGVSLDAPDGRCLLAISSQWDGHQPLTGAERYQVRLVIPSIPAASGRYHLSVFLIDESGLHVHDQVVYEHVVRVDNPRWTSAIIEVPHTWEVE